MTIRKTKHDRLKSISVTFRGFELDPLAVESMVGTPASKLALKGQPLRHGSGDTWKRSAAKFSINFPDGCRLAEMVPALMAHVGGVSHLSEVTRHVAPEFLEIDIVLPIKKSKEQEGGSLSNETIVAIAKLGATLSFQFLE